MAKFIITGDWHARLARPRARLDEDFWATFESKLREIYTLAETEHVDAIICPGDVFDSAAPGFGLVWKMVQLLKDSPCEVLAVPGNHDLHGANPVTKCRTAFGLLAEIGLIRDLAPECGDRFPGHERNGVYNGLVSGHGYDAETDRDIGQYLSREGAAVHVAHGMALERAPGIETMRYTLLTNIAAQTGAPKVLIVGHDHQGFGIKKLGNTIFINPGALLRLSAHPVEFERPIQVAVLEIDGSHIDARLVPLQSARPGHEVLSRAHLEAAALREERTAEFMALLDAQDDLRRLEVSEIITRIAEAEGLPEAVRMEALRRIDEQRARKAAG